MKDFNFNDAPQAALGFVVAQQSHIESEVLKKPYPAFRYAEFVPVDTSANPFAASVTFFTADMTGKAKFMNGKGDDMPLANIMGEKFEQTVSDAGIGYEFSITEIGQAQMLGRNLGTEGAEAARMAYEALVDEVALPGVTGIEGLFNMTGVTSVAAAATFSGGTVDQILAAFNDNITAIWTASKGMELADTVILPLTQFGLISTKRIDATSETTVLDYIQRKNVYTAQTGRPLNIAASIHLTNKMVIYRKSPEVLKLHMPMPLRFLPPQLINLAVRVPGMFRFAPVSIRRPGAVRYVTGL